MRVCGCVDVWICARMCEDELLGQLCKMREEKTSIAGMYLLIHDKWGLVGRRNSFSESRVSCVRLLMSTEKFFLFIMYANYETNRRSAMVYCSQFAYICFI